MNAGIDGRRNKIRNDQQKERHPMATPMSEDGKRFATRIRRGIQAAEQKLVTAAFGPRTVSWIDAGQHLNERVMAGRQRPSHRLRQIETVIRALKKADPENN